MPEPLQEYTQSAGAPLAVDAAQGTIRRVKILGGTSKNGRSYPSATLTAAAPLYEGVKVNIDHSVDGPKSPRSYGDRIGALRNVAVTEEGLFGDLYFNPKHALAEQLIWDAQHAPENVGLSHNVLARTSRREGRVIVEAITLVQSVDLVADPATTAGLFEHEGQTQKGTEKMTLTAEQVKAAPEVFATLREEWAAEQEADKGTAEKDAQISALKKEAKSLKEEVDGYKAKEALAAKSEAVDRMIEEAKIPDFLVSDIFRQGLLEADETQAAALIKERQKIAETANGAAQKPKSKSGHVTEAAADETPEQRAARWRR